MSGLDGVLEVGTGLPLVSYVPLSGRFDTSLGGYVVVGQFQVDMRTLRNAELRFEASYSCITATQTGSIFFYDTTGGDTLITSDTITDTAINSLSTVLTGIPRSGIRTFEVRAGLDPAGSYSVPDGFTVWNARIAVERR